MGKTELEHNCYHLDGDINHRKTVLTDTGISRLNSNGLVVIVAGFFPGGSGSSTTGRELASILNGNLTSSGAVCRNIAREAGYNGDIGLEQFLRIHRDDLELDNQVNAESFKKVVGEAKTTGVSILDSKIAFIVWHLFSNTSDSPLFLTVAVLAGQKIARERLYKREREKAEISGLDIPEMSAVASSRRKRYLEDKYRYQKVYASVGYRGPQSLAEVVNFPPIDTAKLSPAASAHQAYRSLISIPEVHKYLMERKNRSR